MKAGAVASLQIAEEISRGSRSRQQKSKFTGSLAKPEIDHRIFAIRGAWPRPKIKVIQRVELSSPVGVSLAELSFESLETHRQWLVGPPISQPEKGESY